MATLRILSAGAAQAVTERLVDAFKRETGNDVSADFGAVGAMKAKLAAGDRADVIILTRPMLDELIAAGAVKAGSRIDLGRVGTGVAVRAGSAVPDVSNAERLGARIRSATAVAFPDPATATAGKIVMSMLDRLGLTEAVKARLRFFPNGYAAMKWLAQSAGEGDLGITQVTEILPNGGVAYAGPLPDEFQMKAIYSVGLVANGPEPRLAADFAARFSAPSAKGLLKEAGYEL
jgi:molybdate transport system substrate-binding protein